MATLRAGIALQYALDPLGLSLGQSMHNNGGKFLPPQIRMGAEGASGPSNQDALTVPQLQIQLFIR